MPATATQHANGLSDRLAQILEGLCGALAARGAKDRSAVPLILLAWTRLRRLSARFARLTAAVRAGRLVARPTARGSAGPAPALAPLALSASFPAEPARRLPQPHHLPRRLGWLIRLVPEAAVYGSQVQHWLDDPELGALLREAPQAGRILRPLCRALGIRPGPGLRSAWRKRPVSGAVPAASGGPAGPGARPPDAPPWPPELPRPTRSRSAAEPLADPPAGLAAPA